MPFSYWPLHLLFFTTVALPPPTNPSPNLSNALSTNIGTADNDAPLVLRDDLPWGPQIFTIDISDELTSPIDRRIFFITTVQLLAAQAPLDFNGPLPADIVFSLPQFPNLRIAIYSTNAQRPILRKYVFWALTRIMQEMITRDRFQSALFIMKWRGRGLGVVAVGSPGAVQTIMAGITGVQNISVIEVAATDEKATSNHADAVSAGVQYSYELSREEIDQAAIFMGTIGAIFKVAGELNHDFETFVSSFTQYRICFFWESKD
ncbi:MAG: hypothetical protein LQ337_002155 [Flavoplaca oasis]|nr:MAG: hypothetical protein LQ337_002155 [Flavoplaca oasis]